tara:strand:- start:1477 stop:1746 length:270 start_codon:yes stop_codon:yes gene_type:complete
MSSSEESETEWEFNCAGLQKVYKIVITVAGGGLGNGNAYATVEGEWESEDDYNNNAGGAIYYCEYGNNPCRRLIGEGIEWGEDDNFNVI